MLRTPKIPLVTRRTVGLAAVVLALAGAAAPGTAAAAELDLTLDPAATEVTFQVGATGHDVHGHLVLQAGAIHFDPETGAASGEIRVDAASAETGNGSRDRTLHEEVLESESFPLFVFRAQRVSGELAREGESEIELHGQLDVHGAVHPVSLPATVKVEGERLTAQTSFPVPYVEWGMKNPGFLFLKVAPVVTVTVDAAGSLQATAETTVAGNAGDR